MRQLFFGVLVLMFGIVAGPSSCASPPDDAAPSSLPTDTTDTASVAASPDADTAALDTTRRDTMLLPPPPEPLAPSSARLTVAADSCARSSRSASAYACALLIERVEGYGSATPPLAAGQTIRARLPEQLLTPNVRRVFLDGQDTADVLVHHRESGPARMEGDADAPPQQIPTWTIARIC